MKNLPLFCFMICVMISACTIDSTVHFNKDYSGSFHLTMDMGDMAGLFGDVGNEESEDQSLMSAFSTLMEDSSAHVIDSLGKELAEVGATDFKIGANEEDQLEMSFDFDDLETFARINAKLDEQENEDAKMMGMVGGIGNSNMTRKGKWLYIPLSAPGMMADFFGDEEASDAENDDASSAMAMMGSAIKFRTTYTFDRKIKKVVTELPFSRRDKAITIECSLSDLEEWSKDNKEHVLAVKLR